MKKPLHRTLLALLLSMLCGSIGGNIWLYQRSNEYYLQLNSTRLDPFGLRSYASTADMALARSLGGRLVGRASPRSVIAARAAISIRLPSRL